jgi:acyl-coenzyme A synthetase/AMP-(fatty) acid ligase
MTEAKTPPVVADLGLALDDAAPLIARSDGIVTRGALAALATALLERMRADGVERVLVRSDDPLHILRAIDACARAGADLWIAHTSLPDSEIEDIAARFAIELIVAEADQHRGKSAGEAPRGRVHMMTSGTTGKPKIAVHSLPSLARRARGNADVAQNREGKWLLTYQPTGFAGVQVQLTAVLSRGLIVVPRERTPGGFYEAACSHGVEQISATPTFWRSFLMAAQPGKPNLRQITLGGEAADQSTLDRVRAAYPGARVTHIYASTEAGVVFAVHDGLAGFPAAWLEQPVQGIEVRIRDGMLQIKTPNAMRGYVSDTPQPLLEDGWLGTADRCEQHGDRIRVLGRQDSTINVGGSKVYPLAVETFLLGLPEVHEARVFGVANPVAGQLVGAEVVLKADADPATAKGSILAACRAQLPGYSVPRVFKVVDAIAVAASGKKG